MLFLSGVDSTSELEVSETYGGCINLLYECLGCETRGGCRIHCIRGLH